MKKAIAAIAAGILALVSCTGPEDDTVNEPLTYTVTFDARNGSEPLLHIGIEPLATIKLPKKPVRDTYSFEGWFTDNGVFQNEFTAATPVTASITVYAKWLKAPKIVMFGDSITELGDNEYPGGWKALFGEERVVNKGVGGNQTSQMYNRISGVSDLEPDMVFFMGGINDFIWTGDSATQVGERIKSIIDALTEQGIRVIVSSTLYVGDRYNGSGMNTRVEALNDITRPYCAEKNITFLDVNALVAPNKLLLNAYTTDDLHLNGVGYQQWQTLLKPIVTEWKDARGTD